MVDETRMGLHGGSRLLKIINPIVILFFFIYKKNANDEVDRCSKNL